ncbi:MAG: riboflavin biosynthesis protein RibF [Bacteroidales bacterium]|nr:riboflavin biosynthesis protein RibF [Bacteroidales bacterium]
MKTHYCIDEILKIDSPVATIGTFDGVHLGHRAVIDQLKALAKQRNTESLLITFEPHPRIVLNKDVDNLRFINNSQEKERLLANAGVDHLLILPFTYEFSKLSARQFIQKYLIDKLHIQAMIVGYDHHFGRMDKDDEDITVLLKEYGIGVERIAVHDVGDVSVSSTKIRNAIMEGDISLANSMLGQPYSLCGNVIHGNKLGRTIGFPTANLMLAFKLKLLPQDGVYAAWVLFHDKKYKAMLNIGFKPTVLGSSRTIEVHLFDFEKEIYGEFLVVELVSKVRDEKAFPNLKKLQEQLQIDRKIVAGLLS